MSVTHQLKCARESSVVSGCSSLKLKAPTVWVFVCKCFNAVAFKYPLTHRTLQVSFKHEFVCCSITAPTCYRIAYLCFFFFIVVLFLSFKRCGLETLGITLLARCHHELNCRFIPVVTVRVLSMQKFLKWRFWALTLKAKSVQGKLSSCSSASTSVGARRTPSLLLFVSIARTLSLVF